MVLVSLAKFESPVESCVGYALLGRVHSTLYSSYSLHSTVECRLLARVDYTVRELAFSGEKNRRSTQRESDDRLARPRLCLGAMCTVHARLSLGFQIFHLLSSVGDSEI